MTGFRATAVTGMAIIVFFFLGACANRQQVEPVQIAPAMLSEFRLEVNQTELPLQVSSRTLAVVDMARPATEAAPAAPRPTEKLMAWPVEGKLSQPFGCSPFYTGLPGLGCPAERPWFHDGIDLAVPAGTPVRAALAGTVIFAGPDGSGPACDDYRGYGLGVVVDDGGEWQALYAHLSQIGVGVGQVVTPATVIGTSGATGCVSGPHLHFGLRYQESLVDPITYLPDR